VSIVPAADRAAWFQAAKGVTLTAAQVTFLDYLQPMVEQVVCQVCGYQFEAGTYTEYLPAPGAERPPLEFGIDVGWDRVGGVVMPRSRMDPSSGFLQLTRLPARSVTSVYENLAAWTTGATDGDWPAASLLPTTAYRLDMTRPGMSKSGRLIRAVGSWLTSPRCVKVTYAYGYSAGEFGGEFAPVKMAVLEALGWWWGKALRRSAGIRSNMTTAMQLSIRDFSVTMGDPSAMSAAPGQWAQNVLGPEALGLLTGFVNMAKYFA